MSQEGGDDFRFAAEDDAQLAPVTAAAPWKILIADDEPDVHAATRLALGGLRFRGRELAFISAYSGAEVLELLSVHPDVAVIFLDVVMETEDAGLVAARQVRELGHRLVRIILRTGHPGYAPEREVILGYDIHDYKEKTGLDYSKLFSCTISALRAHGDLLQIEQHRRGLLSVLEAVSWFDLRSLQRYLARMMAELAALADLDIVGASLAVRRSVSGDGDSPAVEVLVEGAPDAASAARTRAHVNRSFAAGSALSDADGSSFYVRAFGIELVIHSLQPDAFAAADQVLLELFMNKVAQAMDNHQTFSEVLAERDALVRGFALHLGEAGELHDHDELSRIQRLSRQTAARLQSRLDFPDEIDDWFVFSIPTASGFHDLGQHDLPHELFERPGPLNAEETARIRLHVGRGVELLRQRLGGLASSRLYAMLESVIAQHHERYDGSGYPAGLAGAEIALSARIVGLVDCYVAMTSARPYRSAIGRDEVLAFIRASRATLFDPHVVDAFFEALADEEQPA